MFSYKRFTLNKKLAIIPVVAIVPMIVLAVYLLLTASYTTNAYADITNNVVQANKYVQDFKERVDYTMYLSVIKNKTIDDVKESIFATLEPHEYPASIRKIDKRPYFHFKTNRKMLTAALLSETKQVGFCL